MTTTIGIQGDVGSFSEQAGHIFAERRGLKHYDFKYLLNSKNVLAAVDNRAVDFGVFAIENAQGGMVIESIMAMAAYCFQITDIFQVSVRQSLLTLPGVTAHELTAIHSHRQALRQCHEYLAKHFFTCLLVEEEDTAGAAKKLAEGTLPKHAAVIANQTCAQLYGLAVLEEDIHDLDENLTRFLAASKK